MLDFDGSDDNAYYYDDATLGRLDGATDWTIELWVYPHSIGQYDTPLIREGCFYLQFYNGSSGEYQWWLKVYEDNGSYTYYNADYSVPLNQWSHLAVVSKVNTKKPGWRNQPGSV